MKGKYNKGVPININDLSEDEKKIAFHEWAEGSKALEKLLHQGDQKKFLSLACCAGDTGNPYIAYELDDEKSRKIAIAIAKDLVKSDLDCKVSFLSDFHLTEEEYKKVREQNMSPTRTIRRLNVQTLMENREEVFNKMSKSIKEVELDKIKLPQTEEEIPEKEFYRLKDKNKDTIIENKFMEELKSKTYKEEERLRKDVENTKNSVMKQHIKKDDEKVI